MLHIDCIVRRRKDVVGAQVRNLITGKVAYVSKTNFATLHSFELDNASLCLQKTGSAFFRGLKDGKAQPLPSTSIEDYKKLYANSDMVSLTVTELCKGAKQKEFVGKAPNALKAGEYVASFVEALKTKGWSVYLSKDSVRLSLTVSDGKAQLVYVILLYTRNGGDLKLRVLDTCSLICVSDVPKTLRLSLHNKALHGGIDFIETTIQEHFKTYLKQFGWDKDKVIMSEKQTSVKEAPSDFDTPLGKHVEIIGTVSLGGQKRVAFDPLRSKEQSKRCLTAGLSKTVGYYIRNCSVGKDSVFLEIPVLVWEKAQVGFKSRESKLILRSGQTAVIDKNQLILWALKNPERVGYRLANAVIKRSNKVGLPRYGMQPPTRQVAEYYAISSTPDSNIKLGAPEHEKQCGVLLNGVWCIKSEYESVFGFLNN